MYTIYSKPNCTFCVQAKQLLELKSLSYTEIELDVEQEKIDGKTYAPVSVLKEKVPLAKSVPQIFLNEEYIGGFTELRNFLK